MIVNDRCTNCQHHKWCIPSDTCDPFKPFLYCRLNLRESGDSGRGQYNPDPFLKCSGYLEKVKPLIKRKGKRKARIYFMKKALSAINIKLNEGDEWLVLYIQQYCIESLNQIK